MLGEFHYDRNSAQLVPQLNAFPGVGNGNDESQNDTELPERGP
jgi:hypothetical protein